MTLKERLMQDLKQAMKEKDSIKKSTVTLIRSAIKQKEVDERIDLDENQIIEIIAKQAKQRRDAKEEFERAGRQDLVDQTDAELKIINGYLPEQLDDESLTKEIKAIIAQVGAKSMQDMGKIMGLATNKLKGKADGKRINTIVKQILQP